MKEGTQNMMSLLVAFTARKRFSGVGMVGGDFGSKVLNTKPHAALKISGDIIVVDDRELTDQNVCRIPIPVKLNTSLRMSLRTKVS
jgi:hypothetical protein